MVAGLIALVIAILVVGFILYLIDLSPIDGTMKSLAKAVVIIVVIIVLLSHLSGYLRL